MRKFLISAALMASTVAVAAPAAAQWAPQPYGGYRQPYGNAYGYNNYGQVRRLQVRIDQIQRQIRQLDRRNILSNREARRLNDEARGLEYRQSLVVIHGPAGVVLARSIRDEHGVCRQRAIEACAGRGEAEIARRRVHDDARHLDGGRGA